MSDAGLRIRAVFESLHARGETGLIPFVMAGDPDPATTEAVLDALVEGGADLIELGMPFSDPMADGPDIQAAGVRALNGGMSLAGTLALARSFRARHPAVPLILMGYFNPVLQYFPERFAEACAGSGVDGVILVDLPPEEAHALHPLLSARGIAFIRLIAPTTGDDRLARLLEDAEGFVYTIAVKGITGGASSSAEALAERIATLRRHTALPVAAGFGISTAAQAAELNGVADAVVIGSALIRALHAAEDKAAAARDFVREIKAALK